MVNARNKGKVFERLIANRLKGWPGLGGARRGLTQSGGAVEPDVVAEWGFWVECKHGDHFSPVAAIRQAQRDIAATGGEGIGRTHPHPLLVGRHTRGEIFFAAHRAGLEQVVGVEFVDDVICDAKGRPRGSLASCKSWKVFLPRLRTLPVDGAAEVVGEGFVFGWFALLEDLWTTKMS